MTTVGVELAIQSQAPQLVAEQLINGMHVHAAVPDPEMGVAVLNRIRVRLPVLVAMSANSPLWDGHDTGFAGRRTVIFGRWPVSGPPPHFADLADHERRIQALVTSSGRQRRALAEGGVRALTDLVTAQGAMP